MLAEVMQFIMDALQVTVIVHNHCVLWAQQLSVCSSALPSFCLPQTSLVAFCVMCHLWFFNPSALAAYWQPTQHYQLPLIFASRWTGTDIKLLNVIVGFSVSEHMENVWSG